MSAVFTSVALFSIAWPTVAGSVDLVAQTARVLCESDCGLPKQSPLRRHSDLVLVSIDRLVEPAGYGSPDESDVNFAFVKRLHSLVRTQNGHLLNFIIQCQKVLRR